MKNYVFTFYFYSKRVVSICIEANNLYSALQQLYQNYNFLFSNKKIKDIDIKIDGQKALKR